MAKLFIDNRADVNARDIREGTPLHWTAQTGNLTLLQNTRAITMKYSLNLSVLIFFHIFKCAPWSLTKIMSLAGNLVTFIEIEM